MQAYNFFFVIAIEMQIILAKSPPNLSEGGSLRSLIRDLRANEFRRNTKSKWSAQARSAHP